MKVNQEKIGSATLCYLHSEGKYLLGEKKYGGAMGKVNGFGGKIESTDSDITAAVTREYLEETNLKLVDPKFSGIVEIYKDGQIKTVFYLFKATQYQGEMQESDEMKVYWVNDTEIPLGKTWPSDALWLPILLRNENFIVKLHFKQGVDFAESMEVLFNVTLDEKHHEKYL